MLSTSTLYPKPDWSMLQTDDDDDAQDSHSCAAFLLPAILNTLHIKTCQIVRYFRINIPLSV